MPTADWSTSQLAEFVAVVSATRDEASALRSAVERAAEAFDAEFAAIIRDGTVFCAVGFPQDANPDPRLLEIGEGGRGVIGVPGIGECPAVAAPFEGWLPGSLIVARAGDEGFSPQERNLLRAMGRVLALALDRIERERLLEGLSRIQRSISLRAPLQVVLEAITSGAAELLGTEVATLRVLDPDDDGHLLLVSASGLSPEECEEILRTRVGEGVSGLALAQDRLVISSVVAEGERVSRSNLRSMSTAMAAPVREDGRLVGSLVVASPNPARTFSPSEQEALRAFAEHASLALTDARTVEALREAQREKDMFLATVSHELKTPLTVIMGTLRTIEMHGSSLGEDLTRAMVKAGFERGRQLQELIERLLRGARATLVDVDSEEDVHFPSFVAQCTRGFEHLRPVIVDRVPDIILRTNARVVTEIVEGLLENAVSHAPVVGEVKVHAEVASGEAAIMVANMGALPPGLDPQALFQPFQRGDRVKSPGVGLGLYIAKSMADSIGARIDVGSANGLVAFTLHFPVTTPADSSTYPPVQPLQTRSTDGSSRARQPTGRARASDPVPS